jgi:hypothetical protein
LTFSVVSSLNKTTLKKEGSHEPNWNINIPTLQRLKSIPVT